jgi:hypothetical protein
MAIKQRARVVLGVQEIEKLKHGETLIVRLKDESEIEIKASTLVRWNHHTEGSFESILDSLLHR